LPHFRACTVTSEVERTMAVKVAPGFKSFHVIPNGIDMRLYDGSATERSRDSLIFTGSLRYEANFDAVNWFLKDIYPAIRSEREDVRLTITGDPGEKQLPATPNVSVAGRVPGIREWIAGSMVSIAPIRMGGGTRLKILEAFALGTPVVATSKAAEGLSAKDGEHFISADTPIDFAQSVLRLLRNAEESRQLAYRAREFVRSRYDWRTLSQNYLDIVHRATGS